MQAVVFDLFDTSVCSTSRKRSKWFRTEHGELSKIKASMRALPNDLQKGIVCKRSI